jgi:hypothetical protein
MDFMKDLRAMQGFQKIYVNLVKELQINKKFIDLKQNLHKSYENFKEQYSQPPLSAPPLSAPPLNAHPL